MEKRHGLEAIFALDLIPCEAGKLLTTPFHSIGVTGTLAPSLAFKEFEMALKAPVRWVEEALVCEIVPDFVVFLSCGSVIVSRQDLRIYQTLTSANTCASLMLVSKN